MGVYIIQPKKEEIPGVELKDATPGVLYQSKPDGGSLYLCVHVPWIDSKNWPIPHKGFVVLDANEAKMYPQAGNGGLLYPVNDDTRVIINGEGTCNPPVDPYKGE